MKGTVCLCNSTIAWGGGEKWHLDAALSLTGRGWRVLLICHPQGALFARAPKDLPNLEVVPVAIGRLSFLNPLVLRRLISLFRKERPRAVITNLAADLKAAGLAARSAGVPNIISRRGLALPVRDAAFNRYLYGKVITRLIVNSRATLDMVLANNPGLIPRDRITILPNGLDAGSFDAGLAACAAGLQGGDASEDLEAGLSARLQDSTAGGRTAGGGEPGCGAEKDAARQDAVARALEELAQARLMQGSAGSRPLVLGNAGRLNVQKGQHLLLQLGKTLQDNGKDFRLVIAGTGEREAELKALARGYGIEDKVLFTGFLADMSCFWQAIDVFVLSSFWEGFGFVLLEAMLAEKPALAFGVSNIPELIKNGENGWLFPLPKGEEAHVPAEIAARALHESGTASSESAGIAGSRRDAGSGQQDAEKAKAVESGGESWSRLPFPENMAGCLAALAADPERGKRIGRAGRAFALAEFSQEACMERLEQLFL